MPQAKCPKCEGDMILRSGKFGEFYGCVHYPDCKGTRNNVADYKEPPKAKGETMEKLDALLKENTSPESFKWYLAFRNTLPDIWDKPVSSTGKYHRRVDGTMPTIAEHTYEMVHAATKISRMFGGEDPTTIEAVYLALALHDGLKYGLDGTRPHTTKDHDKLIADRLLVERLAVPSTIDLPTLEQGMRFHAGQWSTDTLTVLGEEGYFNQFIHILDMLSTANCLKGD